MSRWAAVALRGAVTGVAVLVVFGLLVTVPSTVLGTGLGPIGVLLPFVAVVVCAVAAAPGLPAVDRLVERLTHHRGRTPYAALADATARIRSGTSESALPGLAEVLAEGTRADRARIWLAVSDRLVLAAEHPAGPAGVPAETRPSLAVLLDDPAVAHAVPVVEGTTLRAVLAIGKRGPVTPDDQQLLRDVAGGAGLLLRGVAMNTELSDRVRRADELAAELGRSRERLAGARDVERRRLVGELSHATTERLADLRLILDGARHDLSGANPDCVRADAALDRARSRLDDLLDRFRVIARGVYPAVLRDQGPAAALEEVAADLERGMRVGGSAGSRLPWEVESGVYYVAAAAVARLAADPGPDLVVELSREHGRLGVRVVDPRPRITAAELRAALAGELERLVALGGRLDLSDADGPLVLLADLPERLEPAVEVTREAVR